MRKHRLLPAFSMLLALFVLGPLHAHAVTHVKVELLTIKCYKQQDNTFDDQIRVSWWSVSEMCSGNDCPNLTTKMGSMEFSMDTGQTRTLNRVLFEGDLPGQAFFEGIVTFTELDGVFDGDDPVGEWKYIVSHNQPNAYVRPTTLNLSGASYQADIRILREIADTK
jgi:hypothetical protein